MRKIQWQNVSLDVQSGHTLSQAVQENIPAFGSFAQALIQAGEKSGTLAEAFGRMAGQFEEEYFYREKVKTALFYPVLLFLVSMAVLLMLSTLVLPMYESVFAALEIEMPLLTKTVFTLGKMVPHLVISIPIITALAGWKYKQAWLERLPLIREIIKYHQLIHFCGILGRLLEAGISVNESLEQLRKTVTGPKLLGFIDDLQVRLLQGQPLDSAFLANNYFPGETAEILAVGEQSGRFAETLLNISVIFKQELGTKMERMVKLIEPMMILGISFLVGFVALGVLLPVFDLSSQIQ